jgi:basic membrane lipoprotein Med (substrate-binding protein (PBP1-ABC) superfamily)
MMGKGGASLAAFHNTDSKLPADLLAKVKAKQEQIKSGEFRVDVNEAAPQAVN